MSQRKEFLRELLGIGKLRQEEGVGTHLCHASWSRYPGHQGHPSFPETLLSWKVVRRSNADFPVPVSLPPVGESVWLVAGSLCHSFVFGPAVSWLYAHGLQDMKDYTHTVYSMQNAVCVDTIHTHTQTCIYSVKLFSFIVVCVPGSLCSPLLTFYTR